MTFQSKPVSDEPEVKSIRESAEAKIAEGLRKTRTDAEKAIVPVLDSMSGWAQQSRRVLDTTSQWDFSKRQTAKAKCAELRAKFDEAKKQINEMREAARGDFGEITPFVNDTDSFIKGLEKHFQDDPQDFVKGRF